MIQTIDCTCISPDHHGDEGTVYYATVMNEQRTKSTRVAGPFETHREALAAVPGIRREMIAKYAQAPWYLYGTAGVPA